MSRVVVNEIEAKVGNDITFNDTVKIDTLKGKTTAGSVTVQGEGAATTNLQQGLAKSWIHFEGDGTIAISDSFNVSSIADVNTGTYTININNDMSNAVYSSTQSGIHDGGSYTAYLAIGHDTPPTASAIEVHLMNPANQSRIDGEFLCNTIHGDLA